MQTFECKRFWHAPETTPDLSDEGFLLDPDDEYGRYANSSLVPLQHFSSDQLLLLLGEPGSGKSTDINHEYKRCHRIWAAGKSDDHERFAFLDLATIGSDSELKAFFRSTELRDWIEADYSLTMFLDSLDECLLNLQVAVPVLESEIRKLPVRRLRVRLSCRPAELPTAVPGLLGNILGTTPKLLYLAPLRRHDVTDAASSFEISEPDAFIDEVLRCGVVQLATNPITLNFLIRTYKQTGAFPSKRRDLFLQGLRELCRDPRDQIRRSPEESQLRAEQKLSIAARMAAVCIFSNCSSIGQENNNDSVAVGDLAGYTEPVGNGEIQVTAESVTTVLKTALFTGGGKWVHRTYCEFLAAWYISQHKVPTQTALSLLLHPLDPGSHVAPQLHETAAWLASFSDPIFDHILKVEPEILLDSDTGSLDDPGKKRLVNGLLAKAAEGDPVYRLRHGMWRLYERLLHPELRDQLLPWISDSSRPAEGREVACEVAHACPTVALSSEMLEVALNSQEPYRIRLLCAIAIAEGDDEGSKTALRPLALQRIEDDPHDELKAMALTAVWPNHLDVEELFGVLTPARSSVIGMYDSFVGRKLPEKLRNKDLERALRWVVEQEPGSRWSPHERLTEAIIWKAWNQLDAIPELLSSFADAVISRTTVHDGGITSEIKKKLQESVSAETERRHRVFLEILRKIPHEDSKWLLFVFGRLRFVSNADFQWLLSEAMTAAGSFKQMLAELAARLVNPSSRSDMDIVATAVATDPVIRQECGGLLSPVELDSPFAKMARESHEIQLRDKEPKAVLNLDQLLAALDRTLTTDPYAWQFVIAELHRENVNQSTIWISAESLTETARWKSIPVPVRGKIVDAAKHYVTKVDPRTPEWIGTGQIQNGALWGHQAFELLVEADRSWLASMDSECWSKWAGTIVHEQYRHDPEDYLIKMCHKKGKEAFLEAFARELRAELNRGLVTINRITQVIWNADIEQVITNAVRGRDAPSPQRGILLHDLFTHSPQLAFHLSKELFEEESGVSGRPEDAIAIAAAMFRDASGPAWPLLWPKFESDHSFGISILEEAAHGQDTLPGLKTLSEHQLAELYVWMVKRLPYRENDTGARFVSRRDSAEMLRDGLLHALKNRQTFEAVKELSWIQEQLPEATWMRFHVRQGEELARTGTWDAPPPATVLGALLDHEKRVVQNAADLRKVVIESLQRLERELNAETPAIDDLWDKTEKGKFRPKDEEHLSNYVKRHLSRDLPTVIVGREVLIESSYGAQAESTDIHVDAIATFPGGKEQRVSVIVETKGCWNQGLWSDIENQLFARYLRHNTDEGIYLVGWYNCESWDARDYRHGDASKMSLSDAWEKLRNIAADLSKDSKNIEVFVLDCGLPLPRPVRRSDGKPRNTGRRR